MRDTGFMLSLGVVLALAACSSDTAVKSDEQNARLLGGAVGHSVVSAIDRANLMIDAVTGGADEQPGVGKNVDAFSGRLIALQPVANPDPSPLPGKLGCRFVPDRVNQPVLIARADLDPGGYGLALVRNAGRWEQLASAVPGGFNALVNGTTLVGEGVVMAVEPSSHVSVTPYSGESTYPASLTISADAGGKRVYYGRWICGG